jgi:hypothetical protein
MWQFFAVLLLLGISSCRWATLQNIENVLPLATGEDSEQLTILCVLNLYSIKENIENFRNGKSYAPSMPFLFVKPQTKLQSV